MCFAIIYSLVIIGLIIYMSIPSKCKYCGGKMVQKGYSDWKEECTVCRKSQ